MKSLIFAICCFSFAYAKAMPSIGDRVVYKGKQNTVTNSTVTTIEFLLEKKITGFENGNYLVTETMTDSGHPPIIRQTLVPKGDMYTTASVSLILEKCQSFSGERLAQNYPAGSFDTCKITQTDANESFVASFAQVPFGITSFVLKNAERAVGIEIQEYSLGSSR
jgi:hypothetical protein